MLSYCLLIKYFLNINTCTFSVSIIRLHLPANSLNYFSFTLNSSNITLFLWTYKILKSKSDFIAVLPSPLNYFRLAKFFLLKNVVFPRFTSIVWLVSIIVNLLLVLLSRDKIYLLFCLIDHNRWNTFNSSSKTGFSLF